VLGGLETMRKDQKKHFSDSPFLILRREGGRGGPRSKKKNGGENLTLESKNYRAREETGSYLLLRDRRGKEVRWAAYA